MRKTVGFVLLALGAALLAVGIVTTTWAPGVVKKTPLDVDTTTRLDGTAARLDAATGPARGGPARAGHQRHPRRQRRLGRQERRLRAGPVRRLHRRRATPDCPEGESPEHRSASPTPTGSSPTARPPWRSARTATSTADRQVVQHEGVINKFPFDVEKQDYPYWDGADAHGLAGRVRRHQDDPGRGDLPLPGHHQGRGRRRDRPRHPGHLQPGRRHVGRARAPARSSTSTRTSSATSRTARRPSTSRSRSPTTRSRPSPATPRTTSRSSTMVTKTMPLVGFIGGALLLPRRRRRSSCSAGASRRHEVGSSPREPVADQDRAPSPAGR